MSGKTRIATGKARVELPDIGRRLTAARLQQGLLQGTVARRAGIAPSYLSRIETGKIQPTFPMVLRVLRALEVGLNEVISSDAAGGRRQGACPVSAQGRCLLDSIRPDAEVAPGGESETYYTPREVRLLHQVATWLKNTKPDRVRAMEVLMQDLLRGTSPEPSPVARTGSPVH